VRQMFEKRNGIALKQEEFSSFSVKSPDFLEIFFTICKFLDDTVITNRAGISSCVMKYQKNNRDTYENF